MPGWAPKIRSLSRPLQPERAFGGYIILFDRMPPMPQRQAACDYQSDQHTDEKKYAIGGKRDEQNGYDGNRDDQSRRSLQGESSPESRSRFHDFILSPPGGVGRSLATPMDPRRGSVRNLAWPGVTAERQESPERAEW